MTNVLIALDESEQSKIAADAAVSCFGGDTDFMAIYVEPDPPIPTRAMWGGGMYWGGVYAYPGLTAHPYGRRGVASDPNHTPADTARGHAAYLAREAGVDATPIGSVGDPASAILDAADEYDADVIVLGAHQRNWFTKLFTGSTSDDVVRSAKVPVMVVPEDDDGRLDRH